MKKGILSILVFAFICSIYAQEKTIQLYPGKPPGSENWNWQEQRQDSNIFHTPIVYNVVQPTLTVFEPAPDKANGTAIIIAPGGGFHMLSITSEGYDVAKWLAAKGVTAFVLKYRLVHCVTDDPIKEFISRQNDQRAFEKVVKSIVPLEVEDGLTSVEFVRKHAVEYHLNPERIGFIGFSAGGTVTMSIIFHGKAGSRPNFIAPIYAYFPSEMAGNVPSEKIPAFIVAASDDQVGLVPHSIAIYVKWMEAKQSTELHLYVKGGHGFGMKKQNIPTDGWIDRFGEWLQVEGLMMPAK